MRIVLLSETFSEKMGYLENTLPRYLSQLGAEVHLVTTDLPPYYYLKDFEKTYQDFGAGSAKRSAGDVTQMDGFSLHTMANRRVLGYIRVVGLREKLRQIRPDIVQTTAAVGWLPLDAALYKPLLGYKLFTGNTTTASVFPLANRPHRIWDKERMAVILKRTLPGFLISCAATRCYPATVDCADVATRFLGVPKEKMTIRSLGVDTELFRPTYGEEETSERARLRREFGFRDDEIVCIYTGRFTHEKNPLLLAQAIDKLCGIGEPYRGLFVGNGTQAESIRRCRGCSINPFVPVGELPRLFRSADIGVWPTQESMSMLDAAACGLPIVVNDTLKAIERVDGNGLTYRLNDRDDLIRALLSLRSRESRETLGQHGAEKMRTEFGWGTIAELQMADYEAALKGRTHP